jgi:amino acid adenylation domain-containing protein
MDQMTDDMIARRFEAVALAQPDSPAFRGNGPSVTYGACLSAVRELASYLETAVEPGQCVAIDLPKSPAAVAAILACLVAGTPYVPVDHAAPIRRRHQIIGDCEPSVVLTDPDTGATHRTASTVDVTGERLMPEGDWGQRGLVGLRRQPARQVSLSPGTACILYTSGSTGRPKGVVISRANLEYFVGWAAEAFPLSATDQVAQFSPLHFDLSVYDLFVGLSSGACLHLVDRATAMFPSAVYQLLTERRVTVLYAVPSALNALMRAPGMSTCGLPALRRILFAGEKFHVPQLSRLHMMLPRAARLFNLYGPIETNVVTWHEVEEDDLTADEIPIGLPVSGTIVRLWRDGVLNELWPGAKGEIVVAGPAVSPGYLGDPVRTSQARLAGGPDGMFYRTGDNAQVDGHGRLVFRGRNDAMVKVRGNRVEPGEVEAVLTAHPAVSEALVRMCGSSDEATLQASVVLTAGSGATGPSLRQWLARRLPAYMVPRAVDVVSRVPVTSTGKLLRRLEEGSCHEPR